MKAGYTSPRVWTPGVAPVAVVMIALNEGHNMDGVLQSLSGWAQEVFLVDSYSIDETVSIALQYGVYVVQRRFRGFGDQWNFALRELPISAPWTMKIDPDERITNELKISILRQIYKEEQIGISFDRRLWFMGKRLPIKQKIIRIWRSGECAFSDVSVNEHPLIYGNVVYVSGELDHYDSPSLHHWYEKQNKYSTLEAISVFNNNALAEKPIFLGTPLQRRMWLKKYFMKIPFRFLFVFLYYFFFLSLWRSGKVGFIWSKLRADVYRMREYKLYEMLIAGKELRILPSGAGSPDCRVKQYD